MSDMLEAHTHMYRRSAFVTEEASTEFVHDLPLHAPSYRLC